MLAAAALAAAFLFVVLPLPSQPITLGPTAQGNTAVGSFHVHTNRSDGSGSPEAVAAAAARAGLQFVVLTDHGDGTRRPDPPQYLSGVLVIDAVELSTQRGHYIAMGLPQAPYPLRGEPRDVVEDVRRLGGFGVIAHPDSARPSLRWYDWDATFDGMEWLNTDTEWRNESPRELVRALFQYPFRSVGTLASLLDRPEQAIARWDALTQSRRVVAIAGADAHARVGWRDDDANGYRRRWFLRIPSYEATFNAFTVRVSITEPIGRDAASDADRILSAIRNGHVYTAIDAVASPPYFEFSAAHGGRSARQGEVIETSGGAVSFAVRSNAPQGATVVLRRDGRMFARGSGPVAMFESASGHGTYRVEIEAPDAAGMAWIFSNPIYVRPAGWGREMPSVPAVATDSSSIEGGPWHTEHSEGSTARFAQPDSRSPVEFSYQLAPGDRAGQYAALAISVGAGLGNRMRLAFRTHADRPMRISVQARRPGSGERWQRSIYLDTEPRDAVVPFAEMTPAGTNAGFDPKLADTILFVVDTTNTPPGASGRFTVGELRVER
jgi:hypothetical protein